MLTDSPNECAWYTVYASVRLIFGLDSRSKSQRVEKTHRLGHRKHCTNARTGLGPRKDRNCACQHVLPKEQLSNMARNANRTAEYQTHLVLDSWNLKSLGLIKGSACLIFPDKSLAGNLCSFCLKQKVSSLSRSSHQTSKSARKHQIKCRID